MLSLQATSEAHPALRPPDRSRYADYYDRYTLLVLDGDIAAVLENQLPLTRHLLDAISADGETWAYDVHPPRLLRARHGLDGKEP